MSARLILGSCGSRSTFTSHSGFLPARILRECPLTRYLTKSVTVLFHIQHFCNLVFAPILGRLSSFFFISSHLQDTPVRALVASSGIHSRLHPSRFSISSYSSSGVLIQQFLQDLDPPRFGSLGGFGLFHILAIVPDLHRVVQRRIDPVLLFVLGVSWRTGHPLQTVQLSPEAVWQSG